MTRFGRTGAGRPSVVRMAVGMVLVGGLALTTAACGGDDGGSGKSKVASGGGSAGSANKPAGGGSEGKDDDASAHEQMVKYAGCMREHGIDMPDPEPGGAAAMSLAMPADGDMTKTETAMKECEKFQPKSDYDMNDPAFKEWQAKREACWRENGVDMGDGTGTAAVSIDAGDEKVKKALETCDKKVPPFKPKKK
ncbi:hypothetical protein [Embleya sp. NBC_00896]|uniref:hypothetical protein n=1 Tax=Embleya sp. NBC_00896 TaxID=2975961 RepID=UPI0038666ECA|nr:hypothetical protein OG928_04855 [Embleya sp. NBC_00896]